MTILLFIDVNPFQVKLNSGLVDGVASVHPTLWKYGGKVVHVVQSAVVEKLGRNETGIAIHFAGRSIAADISSISATLSDGSLPMPEIVSSKNKLIQQQIPHLLLH